MIEESNLSYEEIKEILREEQGIDPAEFESDEDYQDLDFNK
jgi:hypothetical protein